MQTENPTGHEKFYFHIRRSHVESKSFEFYRCFDAKQCAVFSAHAVRFGKPVSIFESDGDKLIGEIRNRKNYLVNGRTDFYDIRGQGLLGSYSRLSRIYDAAENLVSPRRTSPGKLAKFASKLIPGELGKSVGEITPPYGWSLTYQPKSTIGCDERLLQYAAFCRIEFLRWSRAS